jgi:hypothetical protein
VVVPVDESLSKGSTPDWDEDRESGYKLVAGAFDEEMRL